MFFLFLLSVTFCGNKSHSDVMPVTNLSLLIFLVTVYRSLEMECKITCLTFLILCNVAG